MGAEDRPGEPEAVAALAAVDIDASTGLDAAARRLTRVFSGAGLAEPASDARRLLSAATGRRAIDVIASPAAPIGEAAVRRLAAMAARRLEREPVSRILGERDFYGRPFFVTPATLDPRPDTETVIEAALAIAAEAGWASRQRIDIVDIGSGSGAIAVTLLAELPNAYVLATDISPGALAATVRNAERHHVAGRLRVLRADALESVSGSYDLITSNPPYIESRVIAELEPEVRRYDPRTALDGGPDGLDVVRRIAADAPALLTGRCTPGWIVFEVGAGQAPAVSDLLVAAGFVAVRTAVDLGGHIRCVAAKAHA